MSTSFSEGDGPRTVGPAGWLGVCLVVLAVVTLIVSSPGKPPPSLSTNSRPVEALPGPPVPDRDGVVRAPSPDQSGVAAAYTLAALWKRSPPDAAAFETALKHPPDFLEAGRLLGLRATAVDVTPTTLRESPPPMILLLQEEPDVVSTVETLEGRRLDLTRFVVLAGVRGGQAVILDPLIGRAIVAVPDLAKRVVGKGIFWSSRP
jgi:hypothetical protein